jgi:DNA-directed RNA polymerase subunit RPC12/RpoP
MKKLGEIAFGPSVNNPTSLPVVLECPSCGATLALPDADTFECDYCGKRMIYILSPLSDHVYA